MYSICPIDGTLNFCTIAGRILFFVEQKLFLLRCFQNNTQQKKRLRIHCQFLKGCFKAIPLAEVMN